MNLDYREIEALRPFNLHNDKYLDCPSCGVKRKAYLSRDKHQNLWWNCNRRNNCGQSRRVLENTSYTPPENKKSVSGTTNNESPKDISRACEFIAEHGTLTKNHETRFIKKRKFEPNKNNYFSLTKDLIKSIETIDGYAHSELNRLSFYDLIILERYLDNKPISLRLYSFTNKKHKKITLTNIISLGLYGLENIKPDTIRVIFVEGEEKADQANKNAPPGTVFISIPGIRSTGKAIEFIRNNPNYQYFILFDQENNSKAEPEAVKNFISKVQQLEEANISIKALDIPAEALTESGSKKLGIDDYLVLFSEEERPAKLQSILDNIYTLKEYIDNYKNFVEQYELKRRRVKTEWKHTKLKPKEKSGMDINTYKEEGILLKSAKDHLENGEGLAVFPPPPGSGKSYTSIELLKQDDYIFNSFNRDQRKAIAEASGSKEILSVIEKIENILQKYISYSKEKKESIKKYAVELIRKGFPPRCIRELSNIELDQETIGSLSMTLQKALCTHNKHLESKKGILMDESPLSPMLPTIILDYASLNKISNYYKNPKLSILINCLLDMIKGTERDLLGKNIYKEIEFRLSLDGHEIETLFKEILKEPDNCKSDLVESIRKNKDINNLESLISLLPDKNQKTALIFAIKNKFQSSIFHESRSKLNDGMFIIDFALEHDLKGKPAILMDATADIEVIELLFPNVKVTEYKQEIYIPGIHYTLVPDLTHTAGSLYENVKNNNMIKKSFLDRVIILSEGEETLLVCPKEIKEAIEKDNLLPENITIINYGNSKASNDHKDIKRVIAIPPKVDLRRIERIGNIFGIDNHHHEYKMINSGYIDPVTGKAFYFEHIEFTHKKMQALLKQFREAEIYQALFRIKRDDTEKKFFVLGNVNLNCFGLIPDKILMSNEIVPKKSDQKINSEVDFLEHILLENLQNGKFILNSELMDKFFTSIAETKAIRGNTLFSNKIYTYIENFRLSPDSKDYSDTNKNRALNERYREIRDLALKKLGFIKQSFATFENNKESIILKSSDDLEEAKQHYLSLGMIRPGKQLNSFSQTIGTQHFDTEIKEINCFTLPEAYNLYPTFTDQEERIFNLMTGQMLQFYKDNQLTPGNAKEPLTNHLLNNFGNDTAKAEKFINRFLADIEPSTNDILPMESLEIEFKQAIESSTINLPRTDKNNPDYDPFNAEIVPGENNYLKKAKDTSTNVRAILIERGNQPNLEAPPLKFKFRQCQNQTELEHSTIKALGNIFEELYLEEYTKDIEPQKELEHISSILEVIFPSNIQMLKEIPEADLKTKNYIAYAKGNWTYLLREFKPMLLKTIKEGKLITKEGLSKMFTPDFEKIPEYSNKYYYQLFMYIQFTANIDRINKIITDKKLKNILLTSVIRFENVADLKIKYG